MFIHQSSLICFLFGKASKNVLVFFLFGTNFYGGYPIMVFKGTNFGTHYGLVFKNFLIIGSNSADNVTSSGEG